MRPRRRPQGFDRQLAGAWRQGIQGQPCAVCGSRSNVQAHHVIRQQDIRRAFSGWELTLQQLLWDVRNRLPVCGRCHEGHHSAFRRIPRSVLYEHCPKVFEFARELCLAWIIERDYPQEQAA